MSKHIHRRDVLRRAGAAGLAATVAPALFNAAMAQTADLAPYQAAKVNWKQAEGEQITVAVVPASYFENLISLQPQFEALTGIKLRFEKVPPGQIRQKAMLDLSSKTATYATHAADPMYYALYVANKWVEPLDKYLGDTSLTDPAWFKYDDIIKAWRDADSIDGKPYGIPYDGEVTLQVYRKDLYEAKGLKAADSYDQLVANAKALTDAAARLRRQLDEGQGHRRQLPGGRHRPHLVRRRARQVRAAGGTQLELARHRRCLLPGHGRDLHRRALLGRRHQQSREVQGGGQDRLCALAQGAERQARQLAVELGLPRQCRAVGPRQEGDLAVHRLGDLGGDAGAHLVEVRRPGQALGHQPHVAMAFIRVRRRHEGRRRQLHPGGPRIARARHRRRLAPARAAVARHRRHDGHRHPVGAGRPEEAEGGARRGAGPHPADHERVMAAAIPTPRGLPTLESRERRFALSLLVPALVLLLLTTTAPLIY